MLAELLRKKEELLTQVRNTYLEKIAPLEDELIAPIRAEIKVVDIQIHDTAKAITTPLWAANETDTGTVSVVHDGVMVKETRSKSVKWDQSILKAIHSKIAQAGDDPDHYIDCKFSVQENKFKAFTPQIQAVFLPAREVKAGNPSFEFKPVEVKK